MSNLFKPIFATKDKILNNPISNGSFYVATDTKENFVDVNGVRIKITDTNLLLGDQFLSSAIKAGDKYLSGQITANKTASESADKYLSGILANQPSTSTITNRRSISQC